MLNRNVAACVCGMALAVLGLAGCSGDKTIDVSGMVRGAYAVPQPPMVLSTPAVCLLTNQPGFSTLLSIQGPVDASSGRLFGKGARLAFIPDKEKKDKNLPQGRYSFIWEAASGQGWLISEALQGYAPMSLSGLGTATHVEIRSSAAASGQTSGKILTARMSDGKKVEFTSVADSSGFPAQIEGGTPPFKATFTKTVLQTPPASVFELPQGFTAYPSAEAMVDEMALRFRNLKRRSY